MVKAAYSSGRPAIGVGAGNTPVIIDKSADIKMTVNYTLLSVHKDEDRERTKQQYFPHFKVCPI